MKDFKASADRIAAAREALLPLITEAVEIESLTATNYVIVGQDSIRPFPRSVCHSNIGNPGVVPVCVATEVATRRRQMLLGESPSVTASFVNFLRTDGLWAPYIVDVSEDHLTIDASAPQNVLQALMISSRLVWEASKEAFELFDDALSRGLPARVAFIFAFHSKVSSRDYTQETRHTNTYLKPGDVVFSSSNHRPWTLLRRDGIRKYLESDFRSTLAYHTYQSTFGVRDMFGERYGLIAELFTDPAFTARLAAFRQSREKEEGSAIPNPFALKKNRQPVPTPAGSVTVTEYRNVVLDQLVEDFCLKEEVRNVA